MRNVPWALATGVAVVFATILAAPAVHASSSTRYVSTSGVDLSNTTCAKAHPCLTVQHAVDKAAPGDTIRIAAGTYVEQVTIAKNLTVTGADIDATVIKAPASLIPSADTVADPTGGQINVVEITGGSTTKLSRLTVAGPGPGGCASIDAGISVRKGATLKLSTAAVREIHDVPTSGCQNGDGISVGGKCYTCTADTGHAFIQDVEVTNYQKNGVAVRGTGSTLALSASVIQRQADPSIGSNGVEVLTGATADIRNNSVRGNECDNPTACTLDVLDVTRTQGSGILIGSTGKSSNVSNNFVGGNDVGIYIDDASTISHNRDSGNRAAGIYVDVDATKAHITDNTADNDGKYGIVVGPFIPGGTNQENAGGNTFTHNTAIGNTVDDLYQAPLAGANTNKDNTCDTAIPSLKYWDCE